MVSIHCFGVPPSSEAEFDFLVKSALDQAQIYLGNALNNHTGVKVAIPEEEYHQQVNALLPVFRGLMLARGDTSILYPSTIAIGTSARIQKKIGATLGVQVNVGLAPQVKGKKGRDLLVSTYGFGGPSVGARFKMAEVYVALCYGQCLGNSGAGFFLGADSFWNLNQLKNIPIPQNCFVDFNLNISGLWPFQDGHFSVPSLGDFLESTSFYVGAGLEFGKGAGASVGLYKFFHWNDYRLSTFF